MSARRKLQLDGESGAKKRKGKAAPKEESVGSNAESEAEIEPVLSTQTRSMRRNAVTSTPLSSQPSAGSGSQSKEGTRRRGRPVGSGKRISLPTVQESESSEEQSEESEEDDDSDDDGGRTTQKKGKSSKAKGKGAGGGGENKKSKDLPTPRASPRRSAAPKAPQPDLGLKTMPKVEHLSVEQGVLTERGLRLPFSADEESAIERGIAKHPPILVMGRMRYHWEAILNDPELRPLFHASRTAVNLKDKWRTMQRQRESGDGTGTPSTRTNATTSTKPHRTVVPKKPFRDDKSLITLNVLSPDGNLAFHELAMAWGSVGAFCSKVLARWGTDDGYLAFPAQNGTNKYNLYTPTEDVLTTVQDAGGFNNGNVIAIPSLTGTRF